MPGKQPQTLYICYFGVREPLVRTQVIPYLLEISRGGAIIHLLTFEPDLSATWTVAEIAAEKKSLSESGIVWHHLPYHKSPSVPATFYDILCGARFIRSLNAVHRFDVLHCRVHVPALMGTLARKLSRYKPKIIFDIRGFFPGEYTDAGIWPEGGMLYRTVKRVERWLMTEADGFVVLTEKARSILFPESAETGFDKYGRPVEVIPCCVDTARFASVEKETRTIARRDIAAGNRYIIVYVGSFGGWYLSDEMFDFFAAARENDPDVFIMILTQRDVDSAAEKLRSIGFDNNDFFAASVAPSDILRYLAAGDAAVSFIKSCYSKQASSPTKNAEYLAAGLPIIANPGVGDVDELIIGDGVGVLLKSFDRDGYIDAIERCRALGPIGANCRESAKKRFDIKTVGGVRYRRLYQRLLANTNE